MDLNQYYHTKTKKFREEAKIYVRYKHGFESKNQTGVIIDMLLLQCYRERVFVIPNLISAAELLHSALRGKRHWGIWGLTCSAGLKSFYTT